MSSLPTLLKSALLDAETPSTSLHLLPFHVSYSGPAKVSNYFPIQVIPLTQGDDSKDSESQYERYRSYFRGRMLVGVDVKLPEGYSGHLWKSNAPSVTVNSSNSKASTSKSTKNDSTSTYDSSVDYSASSPRRSPRKHASGSSASAAVNASSSKAATTNNAAKGKKKQPAKKRQRFAMSPDVSPVKEAMTAATSMFEEALDKAAEALGLANADNNNDNSQQMAADDSISSEEIVVTSPAKKRARLEAAEAVKAEEEMAIDDGMKVEASEQEASVTTKAEAASTTIAVAGETITTTSVKLERATTPPPPASEPSTSAIPPSTPTSTSDAIPIHIISPRTPRTPSTPAGNAIFSPKIELDLEEGEPEHDGDLADQGPIHERIIQPIGIFDKITIWNPDMELDRGDDCYVKALSEWTRLADLIHS